MTEFSSFFQMTRSGGRIAARNDRLQVGDFIEGRYQILKILEGGMGTVYICLDHEEGIFYALKTLQDGFFCNQVARDFFQNEIKTWVCLGNHRNIVKAVWIASGSGKRPYIIMEYVTPSRTRGNTLRSYMLTGKLGLPQVLDFAIQICDGMIQASRMLQGIVHRDLKPENIMITREGVVKITDFGLAKMASSKELGSNTTESEVSWQLSMIKRVIGTVPYMAPEQCLNLRVDVRADIYSFGALLYEMLTGRLLFEAKNALEFLENHIQSVPQSPRSINASMPKKLERLVMKCLQKNPEDRFQNFDELRGVLADIYWRLTGKRFSNVGVEKPPEDWELVDRAASLLAINKVDEAIDVLKKVIARGYLSSRFRAKAHNNLGCGYSMKGMFDEPIAQFRKALEIDPNYAKAHYNLGLKYENKEMLKEAVSEFRAAIEANPVFYDAQVGLERCLGKLRLV
jgi:serine/threonine protein kinase